MPSAAPGNVAGYPTSATTIRVNWTALAPGDQNGIIIVYTAYYRAIAGSFSVGTEQTKQVVGSTQTDLTGLEEYVVYTISLSASTSAGEGPKSASVSVTTAQAGKKTRYCMCLSQEF